MCGAMVGCLLVSGCGPNGAPSRSENAAPDLVLRGGVVWTGTERHSAVAVRDGRIVAVGGEDVADLAGPATEVIELAGRALIPGLIDTHVHFVDGGFKLASVSLRDAATPEEFARRLGAFAETVPAGTWIQGGDWDHEMWGGELPRRDWIDAVTTQHPVFVNRLDGHMALANTLAIEAAGVTADTPDPEGGTIERYDSGEPAGVFKDEAMNLLYRVIPDPPSEELARATRAAARHALSHGVTQVHDMGAWAHLETYRSLHAAGELPLRVYSVVPMSTWERLASFVEAEGWGDERLWWGGLKAFVDGSLGSTTAWFHDPYDDEPHTSGLVITDTVTLATRIASADARGLQTIVHAIGDRANDWLLDTYERLPDRSQDGIPAARRDRRPRIEHAQHLSTDAPARFARLGVIASMQPYHAADDGRWAEKRIGPGRLAGTYAFRTLLDAGARVAFGSDWTVAPIDPILGWDAAVTRRTIDGANPNGWVPEQRIGIEETLAAYTVHAAHAGWAERFSGAIEVGKAADMVILDGNPFEVGANDLVGLEVDLTLVDGEVVYRRDGS